MPDRPWRVFYTKEALKDREKVIERGWGEKIRSIGRALRENPYAPPREKLVGELNGAYSKRINRQHRVIYQILEEDRTVKVVSAWSHYE